MIVCLPFFRIQRQTNKLVSTFHNWLMIMCVCGHTSMAYIWNTLENNYKVGFIHQTKRNETKRKMWTIQTNDTKMEHEKKNRGEKQMASRANRIS